MYLIQKENNKIKGKNWLVKIARRANLPDGSYTYNEETGTFISVDFWDIEYEKKIKCYVFNNNLIIPLSFQQANRYSLPPEIEIANSEDKFAVISCYLYQGTLLSFADQFEGFGFKLQEAIENKNIKSLSAEERYFFFKHFQEIELLKRQSELEKLKTIGGRLRLALETAGANYISHYPKGNDIIVKWGYGERNILTQVNNNLKVLHAGFCVSGYDRTQSISSLVLLLRSYEEEGDTIVITREE